MLLFSRLFLRARFYLLATIPLGLVITAALAKTPPPVDQAADAVDLFDALRAKTAQATLIPHDSKRLTLKLANKSDKPLTIKLPAAFAGVPVLAQFPQGNQGIGQNGGGGNGGGQNQTVGGGGGGQGNVGQGNQGNQGNNLFQGLFFVPVGREVKVKIPCVCLEFGKPDPNPRIPYEIRPLESVVSDGEVRGVLALLSRGAISQRIAQLAAWHLANDKSWSDLAKLEYRHASGKVSPQFSAKELSQARKLVELVQRRQSSSESERLSLGK